MGNTFPDYEPDSFPISIPVIAPYWELGIFTLVDLRYAIITPTTDPSLCNQVNNYLSNSTGSSVSVEWILWGDWDKYMYKYYYYANWHYKVNNSTLDYTTCNFL